MSRHPFDFVTYISAEKQEVTEEGGTFCIKALNQIYVSLPAKKTFAIRQSQEKNVCYPRLDAYGALANTTASGRELMNEVKVS